MASRPEPAPEPEAPCGDARIAAPAPLVSIGLPVYNGERYIREAIDSLLAQDYPRFELWISDNASTDGTALICRDYAARDPRIRLVRNARNIGAIENFRAVFARATGEYFMWAAADDRWSSNCVSSLVAALEAAPTALLAASRSQDLGVDGMPMIGQPEVLAPVTQCAPLDAAKLLLSQSQHASAWFYGMFRRRGIAPVLPHLRERRPWGGDVVWLLGLALAGWITGSNEPVFYKRIRGTPSPFAPRTFVSEVGWMAWYLGALMREVVTSRLAARGKAEAARQVIVYWTRYAIDLWWRRRVTNPARHFVLRRAPRLAALAKGARARLRVI